MKTKSLEIDEKIDPTTRKTLEEIKRLVGDDLQDLETRTRKAQHTSNQPTIAKRVTDIPPSTADNGLYEVYRDGETPILVTVHNGVRIKYAGEIIGD